MRTFLSILRSTAGHLALAAMVVIAAAMLLPPALGLERYVITGKSMTGAISKGSVVWEKPVPVAELKVGDVITYEPPAEARHRGLVTHRIASVRTERGRRVFRTKGDFNAAADPWTFTLRGPTQPRVVAHVPAVGYAIAALTDRRNRMLLIGGPALLIAFFTLGGLVRDERRERRSTRMPAPAV